MDWFNNLFIKNADAVNNTELKKAMRDGNITEEEYAMFATSGMGPVSEDKLNQIEEEYTEAMKFLQGENKVSTENDVKNVEKPNAVEAPTSDKSKQIDKSIDLTRPSGQRKALKPESNVDLNGDKNSLLTKLNQEERNLEGKESALSAIVNEQTPELSEAKEAKETAWNKFEEQNKEAAEALKENQDSIDATKRSIGQKEKEISDKDADIHNTEVTLSEAQSDKSALESSISSLKSQQGSCGEDEGEKRAYLQGMISEKQKQVQVLETKIQETKESLAKKEEEYDALVKEKEELEFGDGENSLKTLLDNRAKLEAEYNLEENDLYKEFQKAEADFDTLKQTKMQEAKNDINQSRSNIQALEAKIEELDKKELQEEEQADVADRFRNDDYTPSKVEGPNGEKGIGASNGVNRSSRGNRTSSTKKEQEVEKSQDKYDDAKASFDEKNNALKDIYSGEDKDISAAKANANKSFDDLQNALEANGHSDLANKIGNVKTNLDSKMAELDGINSQILAQENALASATNAAAKNASMISTYEGMLSELQGTDTSKLSSEQKAELNEKTVQLQKEIETAKTTTTENLQKQQEAAQARIAELKEQKAPLEEEVAKLNSELESLLSQVPADCKTQADGFKTAQDDYTKLKETKEATAKGELETARTEMNKADLEVSKLKDAENVKQYQFTTSDLPPEFAAKLDAKLGAGFTSRLSEIAKKYGCSEQDLIGLMYSECGLNPQSRNSNGGATGLIQFMPSTARSLGTSTDALAKMSGVEQLEYVDKYLGQYLKEGGNYSAGDLYTTVFLPAYLKRDILTTSGENYYKWNKGLDVDKNGDISKQDLTTRVKKKYEEALKNF